jgi:hypothetical protein
LLALALAVVFGGGGCANGGDNSSSGGGDDGSIGDGTVEGGDTGAEASGCAAGKTMCGSTCTNTGNDPKNCGKCGNKCPTGQVCSMGMCGFSCSSGETLCGLPPEGGTGMDATGGTDTGASDATTGGDTGASEAGPVVDSGGGTTDAGGPTMPYCANTNNDPSNCGGCGIVCPPMNMCSNGVCSLTCGAGTVACIASGTCIPNGTCCNSGDCPVPGEICDKPGGSCACPGGEKVCTVTNSCISTNDCCKPTDCTVAGSTCPMAGQACQCSMAGYKACLAFNACLPDADCCVPGDCTAPNVNTFTCTPNAMPPTSSTCGIGTCDSGCYDLNKQYSDGCECCDDKVGKSCAAATALGSLSLGAAAITRTGVLPVATDGDWYQVTFNSEDNTAFHGLIQLTTGGGEYLFDVIQGSCNGSPLSCGEGGNCTGKTAWEESYSGPNPAADPNSKTPTGASNFTQVPAVGAVWIHVYRANMAATSCNPYTLSVQE